MTVLTKLAAVRMQERELLALRCEGCHHELARHLLSSPLDEDDPRRATRPACIGTATKRCKCKGWAE